MDHRTVNSYRLLATLLCAAAVASCDKNAVQVLPTGQLLNSRVKFFNFGVGAPGVNFYANDTKMTAISSATNTEATTGVAYGSVGNGGAYSSIAPGAYSFTGKIAAAVDKDLAIARVDTTIADGKYYSFYMCGFYNATGKVSDAFVLEDVYPSQIDYAVALVRFVHVISNAAPLTLYAANTITFDTVTVSGPIAYKSAGTFTAVPPGVYNLFARYTDSTTNKVARTEVSFIAGHVYSIGARGDITITSTTATNRPFLDNTANR
jgi:hypothetical protein